MSRLPEYLDPWRAVERSTSLTGRLPLAQLPRVSELLLDTAGDLEYALEFYPGERRRACVRGFVKASLHLTCQRCAQPFVLDLHSRFNLAVVQGLDEAASLADEFEPLVAEAERVCPVDIIEDELLLALPQIPRHAQDEDCRQAQWNAAAPATPSTEQQQRSDNPFQALQKLKDQLH